MLPCCEIKGLCLFCTSQYSFSRKQAPNGWPSTVPATNQNTIRPVYTPNVLKVSTVKKASILSGSSTENVKWFLWFECKLSPTSVRVWTLGPSWAVWEAFLDGRSIWWGASERNPTSCSLSALCVDEMGPICFLAAVTSPPWWTPSLCNCKPK